MPEETQSTGTSAVVRPLRQEGPLQDLEMGKKMPQAVDLEEAVLGSILIDKESLIEVIDVLKKESFYKDSHQVIYQCVLDLFEHDEPIDMVTVAQRLRTEGKLNEVGGAYYLSYLTNKVASSANAKHYAHIVVQKALKRELIQSSTGIITEAYEDVTDVFDLLDGAEQTLYDISKDNIGKEYESMEDLTIKAISEIEDLIAKGDEFTGVPSGFMALDRLTHGWQKSDLIIVAARPSMGKTALTLTMARNAAISGKAVAVFSLEMSSTQLAMRLISSEAEISSDEIKSGKMRADQIQQIISKSEILRDAPIFIDDTPAMNIFQLRAKCRRMKRKHNIELVIIDYLQLMSGMSGNKGMNREQEISKISRSLKTMAKELDIPVIALSQLSRAVEQRADKRPMLSDLRESGAIEQDADMVLFIYRGERYGQTTDEDGNDIRGISELILAKHRNGSVGTVKLKFIDRFAKFTDLDGMSGLVNMNSISDSNSGSITLQSRMNREEDSMNGPIDQEEETPWD